MGTWDSLIRLGWWVVSSRGLPVSTSQVLGLQTHATVPSPPVWVPPLRLAWQVLFPACLMCS